MYKYSNLEAKQNSPFVMPHDKDTALQILSQFSIKSFDLKLKKYFTKAIDIIYGPLFVVAEQSSQMIIVCSICWKEMNSISAVEAHVNSGNHLKKKDTLQVVESLEKKPLIKEFSISPLHRKIDRKNILILGLQMVECYDKYCGQFYYKCIFCGVHGTVDLMYDHLIGNDHNDNYLKFRFILSNSKIKTAERNHLKKIALSMEPYSVNDIMIIKGENFYPYLWRESCMKNTYSKNDKKSQSNSSLENKRTSTEVSRGAVIRVREDLNYFSYKSFEDILWKLNAIVRGHLNCKTDLYSVNDLKLALRIIDHALHCLFRCNDYVLKNPIRSDEQEKMTRTQREILRRCLGYLREKLMPYFERKYKMKVWI